MITKKPLLGNKTADEKLKFVQEEEENSTPSPTSQAEQKQEVVKRPKKAEYQIALDEATIETLKQRHNLTERTSKASFHWKTLHHKALKNLCNDTDKPAEEYLAEWAIEGLENARKKFYKEI